MKVNRVWQDLTGCRYQLEANPQQSTQEEVGLK